MKMGVLSLNLRTKMTKSRQKHLILAIFMLVISIFTAVFFADASTKVYADETSTTYSIKFIINGEVVSELNKAAGEKLTEADFPMNSTKLPVAGENDVFVWRCNYIKDGEQNQKVIRFTAFTGDVTHEIFEVTGNATFQFFAYKNKEKAHTVVFILPDGSEVEQTVYNGEDCIEPSIKLGLFEKLKYSEKITNVKESMTVNVSIDKTGKYIFMIVCGVTLLAGIVVIAIVVLKMINAPEVGDDEEELVINDSEVSDIFTAEKTAEQDLDNMIKENTSTPAKKENTGKKKTATLSGKKIKIKK